MEQLFSQENAIVLSTMPDEIYIGYDDISDLILSDWNAWGGLYFFNGHCSHLRIGQCCLDRNHWFCRVRPVPIPGPTLEAIRSDGQGGSYMEIPIHAISV